MSASGMDAAIVNRRRFLQLAGSMGAAWALAACASAAPAPPAQPQADAPAPGTPQYGGSLRMAFVETPISLDPAFYIGYVDFVVGIAVYDALVWVDPADQTRTLQPRLATSWTANDDYTSWTFKLREGVQFHHGTTFTAKDVVHTFERILDPDLGSTVYDFFQFIKAVEAVDDNTVRFDLHVPHAHLPTWLVADNFGLIVPHDRTLDQMTTEPSGTGPFRFTSYDPGAQVFLVRNNAYWDNPLPYLDELHLLFMADINAQIGALTSGTIDVMSQVGIANVAALEAMDGIDLIELPQGTYDVFAMNAQVAPFDDVRVRQAVKLSIDRPGLQQVVLQGRGTLGADQPFPPFSPYWTETPIPEQNIEQAKALLTDAGYAEGLDVTLVTTDLSPGLVDAAVAMQEMAKAAGINIDVQRVPPDTYWVDYYRQSEFYVSLWPARSDPDFVLVNAFHPDGYYNDGNWSSEEMVAALDAARIAADPAALKEAYGQMQALIQNDGSVIIPYFRPLIVAKRSIVQDLAPDIFVWDARATWMAQT